MTDKDLRKLNRAELLEMLLTQSKEIEELQAKLSAAEEQLQSKKIAIDEAGSIAQAALQVNGIFDAAQKAADQYLENIKDLNGRCEAICAKREAESQSIADKILAEANERCTILEYNTKKQCEEMIEKAKTEAETYWQDVSTRLEEFYNAHQGLREILSINVPGKKE